MMLSYHLWSNQGFRVEISGPTANCELIVSRSILGVFICKMATPVSQRSVPLGSFHSKVETPVGRPV